MCMDCRRTILLEVGEPKKTEVGTSCISPSSWTSTLAPFSMRHSTTSFLPNPTVEEIHYRIMGLGLIIHISRSNTSAASGGMCGKSGGQEDQ